LLRWDPQSQDTEELINGNDQFVDVVLSPNRRTLFAAHKYGRVVGVELTSDRTNGYDPWNPQGIVLHSIVERIDQLIAYQVFQDNPEGTAEQQRSGSTSGASPVIDAVAIVVKSEGRILSWCLDQQIAVDLFQAPEDHEIAEAVPDQNGSLLVRLVHKNLVTASGSSRCFCVIGKQTQPSTSLSQIQQTPDRLLSSRFRTIQSCFDT
jgi:hypothetical protein